MKSKIYRFERFDAGCLLLLLGSIAGAVFAFRASFTIVGACLTPIALFFLLVLCGRLACPYYFEKRLVGILLKNNHRMKIKHLKTEYNDPDTFDFVMDRLKKRKNLRVENGTVRLDEHRIRKGVRNYFVMRGIRNLMK